MEDTEKELSAYRDIYCRRLGRKEDFSIRVEGNSMKDFKVFYDEKEDILYLGKEGQEEEIVELATRINVELKR